MGHGCEPGGVCQPEAESKVAPADSGESGMRCREKVVEGVVFTTCSVVPRVLCYCHAGGLCVDTQYKWLDSGGDGPFLSPSVYLHKYFFPSSPLTRSRPLLFRILLRSAVRLSLVGATCSPPTTPCYSPLRQGRSSSQLLHSDLRGRCMPAAEESEDGGSSRDTEVAVCLQSSWRTHRSVCLCKSHPL